MPLLKLIEFRYNHPGYSRSTYSVHTVKFIIVKWIHIIFHGSSTKKISIVRTIDRLRIHVYLIVPGVWKQYMGHPSSLLQMFGFINKVKINICVQYFLVFKMSNHFFYEINSM